MQVQDNLKNKGLGIATAHAFDDETSSMIHEQLARLKFAELNIPMKDKRILDYGCGTGYNSYYISQRQSPNKVVGVDILDQCIEYCKKHYTSSKTEYHVQDALIYNPRLGLFDLVISCEVIEHIRDQNLFLTVLNKYLQADGFAFISTPNKGLFSFGKESSFINKTHVKELFFDEFNELLNRSFSSYKIYSQVHTSNWHSAYINYLCASNLAYALKYEIMDKNLFGSVVSRVGNYFLQSMFRLASKNYPDVYKRKYTDFQFVQGFDNRAIWFVALCSNPKK